MRAQRVLVSVLVGCVFSAAGPVSAQIRQPNGQMLPRDSQNGEVQLFTMFQQRMEGVDWQRGSTVPATYSPLCDFRATLVLKQSGSSFGVGWYNATGRTTAPSNAEIFQIVAPGAPVGTVVTGANIRSDARYMGGEIGFALLRGGAVPFTTEPRWNPLCSACNPAGNWIMSVSYPSTRTASAFYVAFEDGDVGSTPNSFGNDGDYNDYVFFFEGLQCSGGGTPCNTGMQGICAQGVTECDGTTCRPAVSMRAETCNGLDDDCDGTTDDGDLLCPGDRVCDRGTCVENCASGEFQCPGILECNARGVCVSADCAQVDCPPGQVCRMGACRAACDGVTCPGTQTCRAGACVDPCAGVTCPAMQACLEGVCRTSCTCGGCPGAGLECDSGSGRCVPMGCAGVDCSAMPGTVCRAGACVDACDGAVCPAGQRCTGGECVEIPPPPDAGMVPARPDAGSVNLDGGARDAGAGRFDGGRGPGPVSGGCGCAAPGRAASLPGVAVVLIAVLGVCARRRKRSC